MDTVRAFVGCLLDLGTTRRVVELGRAVKRNADGKGWRAAWVPPPNVHVTIKFLGDVDQGLVAPLSDALAAVARKHAPLRLGVAGVGAFPPHGTPRVLFAQIHQGHDALAALARDVDAAFVELGLPREKRAFHGHATLARVKHAPAGATVADITPQGAAALDCGTGLVAELTLYRSDLLRAGAEYHALSRHPLGDGAPDPAVTTPSGERPRPAPDRRSDDRSRERPPRRGGPDR